MAGSVNKVTLIGNLGKDPEIRSTQEGNEIANLSVATSESWKNRAGERQEKTEWHKVVIYAPHLVTVAKNYLKKGSKVYIEGSLQTRKWLKDNATEVFTTEVVLQQFNGTLTMLDGKEREEPGAPSSPAPSIAPAKLSNKPIPAAAYSELNDDIPF